MLVDTLLEKAPLWFSDDAPEAATCIASHCTLARNLADYPFSTLTSEDDKRAILDRVTGALDAIGLLSAGRFYALHELSPIELRFLAERRLITYDLLRNAWPRGVFVSEDQCASIMINGQDHLYLRVILPGFQVHEAYSRLNVLDEALAAQLDYAFTDRLGFLTTALNTVGTGMKASVMMHLPALGQRGRAAELAPKAAQHLLHFQGLRPGVEARLAQSPRGVRTLSQPSLRPSLQESLYSDISGALACPPAEAVGDLYLLVNQGTLGISEDEVLFHLRHALLEVVEEEKTARASLLEESRHALQDSAGRARGIASGAHLMGFDEGLRVLSALRLGSACGVLGDLALHTLNEVLVTMQAAHLEMARGRPCDGLTLSMERAALLRARIG